MITQHTYRLPSARGRWPWRWATRGCGAWRRTPRLSAHGFQGYGVRLSTNRFVTLRATSGLNKCLLLFLRIGAPSQLLQMCRSRVDACLASHRCTNISFWQILPPPFMPATFGSSRQALLNSILGIP